MWLQRSEDNSGVWTSTAKEDLLNLHADSFYFSSLRLSHHHTSPRPRGETAIDSTNFRECN